MPQRYYRELIRYFTRHSGDNEVAADVVQESYLRMFALQQTGTLVSQPRALLYQTGRHLLIDEARRQAVERAALETLALIQPESAPGPEGQVAARELLERFARMLMRLPAKRREVFVLVRTHGFSYREVSEHMQISAKAVEQHMMRALLDCAGYGPD